MRLIIGSWPFYLFTLLQLPTPADIPWKASHQATSQGSRQTNCRPSPLPSVFETHPPSIIPALQQTTCCACPPSPHQSTVDHTDHGLQTSFPQLKYLSQPPASAGFLWEPSDHSCQVQKYGL